MWLWASVTVILAFFVCRWCWRRFCAWCDSFDPFKGVGE